MSEALSEDVIKVMEKLHPDVLQELSELVDQLKKETDQSVRKEIIQTIGEILQPHLLIAKRKSEIDPSPY